MTLIGLGYKARQGKNLVADFMKSHDNRVKIYAFATELKLYCREHHDELLGKWQLANQTKQVPPSKPDPVYGCTPILQWQGTDVARAANPNVWVQALARRIETEKPQIAVVCDVRFPNEAEWIKESGGYLVEVIRRSEDESQFLDPGRDPRHVSETALEDYEGWDFVISCQTGNLANLKAKAIGVLNAIQLYEEGDFARYFDEPVDYSDAILDYADSQSDGFKP